MLKSELHKGSQYVGNIYMIDRFAAEQFEAKGSAMIVNLPTLTAQRAKLDLVLGSLQSDIEDIKQDTRLSDQGKREDIQELVAEYQGIADGIQSRYVDEITSLKSIEFEKVNKFTPGTIQDVHELQTRAGLIKSEISMARNFELATEAITSNVPTMERSVARELLSQFADIKRELDGKKRGIDVVTKSKETAAITAIYDALQTAAMSPEQATAAAQHRMIEVIGQQRGDIRKDFDMKVRALLR